ncbi:MAG: Rieske 2Fe-2S domain-containing protein [Chloroflexota bacterium]
MADAAVDADVKSNGISRREFLYYIWGASLALYLAQFSGLLVWFLIPRFREGEFGGLFPFDLVNAPLLNGEPVNVPDGRFWIVDLDTDLSNERMYLAQDEPEAIRGVAAIYTVCTHLGCIYSWIPANNRFECPCHGSKYRLDGRRIESPAPRTLDRFKVIALDAEGNPIAESELVDNFYRPLVLPPETVSLSVDTGSRKQGPSDNLLCDFEGNCP